MRFKNYRNKYNNQNRIFSEDDVFDMTLGSFFDNENDLLAQNREIGVPSVEELRNSQNTKWVEPFVNDKGINDGGYWQSDLDENQTPQILESFAPKNNIEQLAYNSQNEPQYTLEGAIQHNVIQPIQNLVENIQNSYSTKYEGLTPKAVIQKAAAKLPIWKSSAKEYYQHALKRADGEEPTDFMKEQNDFKKIHEIYDPNLRQMFINKAAKMYDLDVNDPATYDAVKDTEVVFPKLGSQLNSQIKESKIFQKWVAENYENIKNQTNKNESMIFAPSFFHWGENGLFATINNTDLKNSKINEDGSFSTLLSDAYDFTNLNKKHYKDSKLVSDLFKTFLHNRIRPANNRAKEQQDAEQLQRYLLSTQINLSKEEVDKILRKYKRIR